METGRIDEWPLKADTPLPHIATDDIGRNVAWSFAHPDQSIGQTWEIVGGIITFPVITQSLSKRLGRPFVFVEPPMVEDNSFFSAFIRRDYQFDPLMWVTKFEFQMATFQEFLNKAELHH